MPTKAILGGTDALGKKNNKKKKDKKRQLTFATESLNQFTSGLLNSPRMGLNSSCALNTPLRALGVNLGSAACAEPSPQEPGCGKRAGKAGKKPGKSGIRGLTCLDPFAQHPCPSLAAEGRAGAPGAAAATAGLPGGGDGLLQKTGKENRNS